MSPNKSLENPLPVKIVLNNGSAVEHKAEPAELETFDTFGTLPIKIRQKIRKFALPGPRVIELCWGKRDSSYYEPHHRCRDHPGEVPASGCREHIIYMWGIVPGRKHAYSPLLITNKEARSTYLDVYREITPLPVLLFRTTPQTFPCWYFDPKIDTLMLTICPYTLGPLKLEIRALKSMGNLMDNVRFLCVQPKMQNRLVEYHASIKFENIETIYIIDDDMHKFYNWKDYKHEGMTVIRNVSTGPHGGKPQTRKRYECKTFLEQHFRAHLPRSQRPKIEVKEILPSATAKWQNGSWRKQDCEGTN